MEDLIKSFAKTDNEKELKEILSFAFSNPIDSYLKSLPELITAIVNSKNQIQAKQDVLFHLIDLFVNRKIPPEQIGNLPFERLFNHEERVYQSNPNEKALELFYSAFFPNQDLINSLTVDQDTEIDFLSIEKNTKIMSWTKGVARVAEKKDHIMVTLEGVAKEITLKKTTYRIQPRDLFSKDYEWRTTLKKGDEVDFLDKFTNWYRGTVVNRQPNSNIIKIGLRTSTTDQEGEGKDKLYVGYGEEQDIECNIHDSRLRPPRLFSRDILHAKDLPSYPIENKLFNEEQTQIPFNDKFYILPKEYEGKNFNSLYYSICNYYLKAISSSQCPLMSDVYSIANFDYYCTFCNILFVLHKRLNLLFAIKFFKDFYQKSIELLMAFSRTETRNFKKTLIQTLLKKIKDILRLSYYEFDLDLLFESFGIDFGLNCFKTSTILEKQLLGITILSDTLKAIAKKTASQQAMLPVYTLISSSPNIFSLLFESNSHSQIIQKSSDVVSPLFQMNLITEKEALQLISYLDASRDQEIAVIVYKILSANSNHLTQAVIKSLIDYLLNKKAPNAKDITLLIEIAKASRAKSFKEISDTVIKHLFELIMSNNCPLSINTDFCFLLKCEDNFVLIRNLYLTYLSLLMTSLNTSNFQQGMRLMKMMLTTMPSPSNDEEFKKKIQQIIFGAKNIFNEAIFFFKKGLYDEAVFDFLTDLLENGGSELLTNEGIQSLFEIFSNGLAIHNRVFFKWLKEIENKKMIDSSSLEFLFHLPVKEEISKELFEFLWTLFISINKIQTGAEVMKSEVSNSIKSTYTGTTSTGKVLYSVSYAPSEKPLPPNFILPPTKDPFDLKYFDIIYVGLMSIKSDEHMKREIVSDFFQLFPMKGMTLGKKKEVWMKLIDKAINFISNPSSSIQTLRNAISILTLLIEESERKGTAGCVSHMASMKSSDLTIKITNSITKTKENKAKDIELTVKSNLTIWDLKKTIAQHLDIIPECIKILHNSNEISDRENGVVISKKFNKESNITVAKSNVFDDIPKVALIKDGQLTPEITQVFTEIFEKFSTDGRMNRLQCSQFAYVAVDSIESISVDDPRVRIIFDKYDTDKDDFVTLEGFIQFFHDAIEIDKKVYTVWENIKAFNYRNDLKKFNEPLEDFNNDNDYSIMPRYIMGQEQHIFEAIFACQNSTDKDLAKEASELINKLCTNKKYFSIILDNGKELEEIMTKETNEYILFYIFQIVESFFENKNEEVKRKWLNDYLTKGGFEHLLQNKFLCEPIDNISSKVALCLRKIVLGSFEMLMNMEQYDSILDKDYLTDEMLLRKDLTVIEIASIDVEKYKVKEILGHLYHCIESLLSKEKFEGLDEDISKKQLSIFAILTLYLKGDIILTSDFNLEEFILKGLLYAKESIIRKQFCFTFGFLFLETTIDTLRNSLFSILERKAFDLELIKKYNSSCLLSLYETVWKIKPLPADRTEVFVKKILQCLSSQLNQNQLLGYLQLLSIALDHLSPECQVELCQEKQLLQQLVNNYLLEDLDKASTTKEPPEALFTVIRKLIKSSPDNLHAFFTLNKVQTIAEYISKLKQGMENYNPMHQARSTSLNYIGIHNLRNICYINSVIQQFFNISAFRYGILLANDNLPPEKTEISDDNLLHQLQRMFTFLQMSNRHDFVPTDFVYSFKDIDNKPTDVSIQCDAQEFLSRFMEKTEIMLSKTAYKYLMKSIFYGETCSQLLCQNGCGSIRNRFEELLYLSLDIKNVTTLNDTLLKYIGEETIDDFLCEQCQKKTKHSKRISLNKLPNVLMIHLQRITFNYESFLMEKINSKLEFPMQLSMKPYTTETISQPNPDDKEYDSKVYEHSEEYYQYELKGVVVHNGTAQFGHYYSFINTKLGDHNKWYRFDDSTVFPYSIDKLSEDTFGGDSKNKNVSSAADWFNTNTEWEDSTQGAYMLVYERKLKAPLLVLSTTSPQPNSIESPIEVDSSNEGTFYQETDPFNPKRLAAYEDAFLDCEDTASSRKDSHKPKMVFKLKDDCIELLPYYAFIRDPNLICYNEDYLMEVRRDNILFKNDMSIYHPAFIDLIKSAAKELSEQSFYLDNSKIEVIYRTIAKITIEIITKYNDKKDINDILNYQLITLKDYPFLAEVVLKEIWLNKTRYVYTLILTIEDKVNQPFTNLLNEALITAMKKDSELNETAATILDYLYSLLPVELSKNWVKMVNFLEIFEALAKEDNENILDYLYEKNTITVLIDFFLGKESPLLKKGESRNEIGNKTVNAKFAPLISTLSILIRRCPNFVNEINPTTFIKSQKDYSLNQTDLNTITHNAFYKKAISESYHHAVLSKLLSHLMYNDLNFTQKRIYSLLDAISTSSTSTTEVKSIFSLLFNIMTMEDNHSFFRYEAIFGIPMLSFKAESLTSDKLVISGVKYRSSLFPNKDSLIKRMINRWRSSVDNIMFISYLFGIVFGGKSVFNYYQALLNPKEFHLSLNDYIVMQSNNEIDWLKTCNFEKKYENYIQIIHNCSVNKYKEKVNEIESEKRIEFFPRTPMRSVLSERIVNVVNEEFNSRHCYLIRCDYVVEVGELGNECVKADDKANQLLSDLKEETKGLGLGEGKDDALDIQPKEKTSRDASQGSASKEKEQQESLSLEDHVIHSEELMIESNSNKSKYDKPKQNDELPLFHEQLRADFQPKSNSHHITNGHGLQEKKYYLDNIGSIIKEAENVRVFREPSGLKTINLRLYLLINNSDQEYRTSIRITETSSSYYYPQSALINFLKKKSCSQVITLCPKDQTSSETLKTQIIPFDVSNKVDQADQYEDHFQAKTSNRQSNAIDELIELGSKGEKSDVNCEKESANTNKADNCCDSGFEMMCPGCNKKITISDDLHEMRCQFCKALLFQ